MTEHEWAPAIIEQLRLAAAVFSQALARKASLTALQRTRDELDELGARRHDRASEAGAPHRHSVRAASRLIVSESAAVRHALAQVEQVAPTPSTVLLLGETGVGKEVFAQTIHELSARHQRQMIRVSCAAIPSALIESELFGRERGAYTGALYAADRPLRSRPPVDPLPRRNRRALGGSPGQAAPRAPGPRDRAARQHAADQGRCPHHRRQQPQSRKGGRRQGRFGRTCSTGSTCSRSSSRRSGSGSRTFRGWSWEFVNEFSKALGQADRIDLEGVDAATAALLVAGEHPRAAQRHRARRHHVDRPPADRAGAPHQPSPVSRRRQ